MRVANNNQKSWVGRGVWGSMKNGISEEPFSRWTHFFFLSRNATMIFLHMCHILFLYHSLSYRQSNCTSFFFFFFPLLYLRLLLTWPSPLLLPPNPFYLFLFLFFSLFFFVFFLFIHLPLVLVLILLILSFNLLLSTSPISPFPCFLFLTFL